LGSSWESVPGICGSVPEGQVITLSCAAGGGTITKVDFASFGLPDGVCGNFSINPICNAKDTTKIVEGLCLGKSTCSVFASDTVFGDPCFGTFKRMKIQVSGCAFYDFVQNATIPVNSMGTVVVPTFANNANSVTISESGKVIWSKGQFVSGDGGVISANASLGGVAFRVGSGSYSFAISGTSSLPKEHTIVCASAEQGQKLMLTCPKGKLITRVKFASFGTGHSEQCGELNEEHCTIGSSKYIVERQCLGKRSCVVDVESDNFGTGTDDLCPGPKKTHCSSFM